MSTRRLADLQHRRPMKRHGMPMIKNQLNEISGTNSQKIRSQFNSIDFDKVKHGQELRFYKDCASNPNLGSTVSQLKLPDVMGH